MSAKKKAGKRWSVHRFDPGCGGEGFNAVLRCDEADAVWFESVALCRRIARLLNEDDARKERGA